MSLIPDGIGSNGGPWCHAVGRNRGGAMIELDDVTIRSGPFALLNLALSIPLGAYAVLSGTGQGKTTILEASRRDSRVLIRTPQGL